MLNPPSHSLAPSLEATNNLGAREKKEDGMADRDDLQTTFDSIDERDSRNAT